MIFISVLSIFSVTKQKKRKMVIFKTYYRNNTNNNKCKCSHRNSSVKESRCGSVTDPDSDDDNEEGDYTVYECPGLAPVSHIFL